MKHRSKLVLETLFRYTLYKQNMCQLVVSIEMMSVKEQVQDGSLYVFRYTGP